MVSGYTVSKSRCSTVILACGHSMRKRTSFSRQLTLLSTGLGLFDFQCILMGTKTGKPFYRICERTYDVPVFSDLWIRRLCRKFKAESVILLGYPDQFSFCEQPHPAELAVYLWAQFSYPPNAATLRQVLVVPLTETTRIHLSASAVHPLGPTIPHAVDTDCFRILSPGERTRNKAFFCGRDCFTVGTVGANITRKRFDRLIEGFSLFYRNRQDICLLIKTDNVKKPGGFDVVQLLRRYGVESVVRIITAELSDEEMVMLYSSMDVYLHTAEWEGFGIPVIEAMACGVPVFTPPIQGPGEIVPYVDLLIPGSELVRDGSTVLRWVKPMEIAAVLDRAYRNEWDLKKTGSFGRREVEKKYSLRAVAKQWKVLIENTYVPPASSVPPALPD